MHRFKKMLWTLRAFLVSPMFGRLRMPSYLGPPLLIVKPKRIFIERRVRIFPGMRAEAHYDGTIKIAENVAIGQNFHITAMGELTIGSGTVISGAVMVTDIDHEYADITKNIHEQGFIYGRTAIGKNCFIGMGARIQAGTILGDGCIVGANSVVRGEFPSYCVIVGAPARVVKKYDFESATWNRC
ncbi:acyltransferase [Mycolicibacterium fluoranthenivorans]|uniref:Acetyltransferase (Isoleucine patch superfamily) n=1 Tax=Mycolicibacterium fluoranthenivorans TaxID=258505 RepID=A0A1G4WVE7_9MYCO|nr:acyltransferase [Mycolicibacterium fluoranthenivorans]SCX30443.1 Acetyltransferase (isoleucine patch superfamily) [Mycolicibacterium fluoranthenivorans]